MKRLVFVPLALLLGAALVPAAALGKGASKAEIAGPGLDRPISLAGEGQVGGQQLMQLAEAAGFFPAVFVTTPDPMLEARPTGDLGPRYTIDYVMPGPNAEADHIRQDLYPYANPSPVTYTEPGQAYFGTEKTRGGWYVATASLKDDLVATGLPETAPIEGGDPGFPWTVVGGLVAVAAIALLAGVAALLIRRRPGPATA
jgi:hypothetical protein